MSLRIRVRLPDRPGSLGKVAHILGAAGADVVQMAVLERDGGRALDDFTVAWPSGAGIDRLCEGLAFIPGVEIEGVWPTGGPQEAFPDTALIGRLAGDPESALAILADGVPGIFSADWAGLLHVGDEVVLMHASLVQGAPGLDGEVLFGGIDLPELRPLRARAFTSQDGTQYAVVPIGATGLAILMARTAAPSFHRTEVSRLEQLVGAAEAVLGERLLEVAVTRP